MSTVWSLCVWSKFVLKCNVWLRKYVIYFILKLWWHFASVQQANLLCFHHNAVKLVPLLSTAIANNSSWHQPSLSNSEFYVWKKKKKRKEIKKLLLAASLRQHTVFIINQPTLLKLCKYPKKLCNELLGLPAVTNMPVSTSLSYL